MKLTYASLAFAALLGATSAQADQLEVATYDVTTPGNSANSITYDWDQVYFTVPANSTFINTAGQAFTVSSLFLTLNPFLVKNATSGTSFIAFCYQPLVALSAAAALDSTHSTQTYNAKLTAADAGVDAGKLANVQRLFDLWGPRVTQQLSGHVTPPSAAAGVYGEAMQLAIWNLVLDSDFTLSSGAVQVNLNDARNKLPGNVSDVPNIVTLANSMLTDVGNTSLTVATPSTTTLWVAQSGQSSQMLVQSTAVIPEPSSYALVLAGLGVVGFSLRRRHTA